MPRQMPGDEGDHVDADDVAGAKIAHRQPLGGNRDPAQAVLVKRPRGGFLSRALLDLNERQGAAARRTAELKLGPACVSPAPDGSGWLNRRKERAARRFSPMGQQHQADQKQSHD